MNLFRIFIFTFFAISLIACGGAEERKAVYMEKAKSSIAAGDFDKARIELKNVLQIDPKDAEAYFEMGKLLEQSKSYRKAFSNYLKAEELNPDLLANQARLGKFYLLLVNDPEKTQEKIDLILSKDPVHTQGLLLRAALLIKEGKKDEALKVAEEILVRNPADLDVVIFLASINVKDGEFKKAIKILDVALKSNLDNDQLNNVLVMVLVQNKQYDRAEEIYKTFLKKYPDNRSSYVRLAFLYDAAGNTSKSEDILRASIKNKPDDADRYLILVKYINQVKGEDEAVKALEELVKDNNSIVKLRAALAELYYVKGEKQLAIEIYEKIINDYPEEMVGVEASIALALHYFNVKEFDKASEIVEKTINVSPNNPRINIIRARLAIQNSDTEKAIIALRIVIKETPENIDAYFMLVNTYKLESNEEQVVNTLNTAYENNKGNPPALLKLTKYYLGRDFEKAEKIIDSYNQLKDSDYEGMSIKAAILNANNKMSESYALAKKLIELFPDKPNGYMQSVPYLSKSNNLKDAVSVLEKGYVSTKDNRKILLMLTKIQVSEAKFDDAEKRIKVELAASPDDVELKILLAKVYMSNNRGRDAESLLNEVVIARPEIEEPYLLLSNIYKNINDKSQNKSILVKGHNSVAASYKISLKLASLYEAELEYDKAINVYRDLYEVYADNMVVINNLASLLSDYSDDKNDLKLIKLLVEKLEKRNEPIFLDTIGWAYYKLSDYQKAIQYLTQVVEKSPDINVFNYHLGMTYKMSGDKAQAKVYLQKSLADGKQFKEKDLAGAALKGL